MTTYPEWKLELANEIVRQAPKRFPRRKFYSPGVDDVWAVDLLDCSKRYVNVNRGHRYALIALDIFSRYAYACPMKNKNAAATRDAFLHIFSTSKHQPKKINCDRGTEFYNSTVKKLLKERGITIYSTHNDVKASLVERLIRTLRRKILRHFILSSSTVWYTILQDVVDSYNSDIHRSIHMTPAQARLPENHDQVYKSQFPTEKDAVPNFPKFLRGEQVRISLKRKTFDKEVGWTEEVFKVDKVIPGLPPMYELSDLLSEPIQGRFYSEQLQPTEQKIYRIDRVLRKRNKNGKREVLVRWFSYGPQFDSWIDESEVQEK